MKTLDISFGLSKYIANEPHRFSLFIKSLQLSESDIYNIFHDNINDSKVTSEFSLKELLANSYPYLSDDNSIDDNIEIIRNNTFISF